MWRRLLAAAIDVWIMFLAMWIEGTLGLIEAEGIALVNFAGWILYFAGMEYYCHATVGKRLCGLKVILPNTGEQHKIGLLALRAIVRFCFVAPPLGYVYGGLIIWSKDGKSVCDRLCRSRVVDSETWTTPAPASLSAKIAATAILLFAPWFLVLLLMAALCPDTL